MNLQIDPWQIASGVFGIVVWFLRLEGRVKALEKQDEMQTKLIDSASVKAQALETKVFDKLSLIETTLARIEGKLEKEE